MAISCQSPPTVGQTPDQPHNYCKDSESWKEWDDLVMKYPDDMDIQALHALRIGLCIKVEAGTISFEVATDIFNRLHDMVIDKKKAEAQGSKKDI